MHFLDTWQELEEIYDAPYMSTGVTYAYRDDNGLLYHFYEDLPDLIHSLSTRSIYSTKNDERENIAQFDHSAEDGTAYVCMTNTLVGKNYMTNKRNRPFGLSFKRADLEKHCEGKHQIRSFDAFAAKGDSEVVKNKNGMIKRNPDGTVRLRNLADTEARGSNPFRIFAIGELEPGRFFICGGQDVKNRWPSQIFNDRALYQQLRDWFVNIYTSPSAEEYQRRSIYHFKQGNVGEVLTWATDNKQSKPVNVSGNLNTNYVAKVYHNSKTNKNTYTPSMVFSFDGKYKNSFVEVIGTGPIEVKDDKHNLLLGLEPLGGKSTKGTYKSPLLLGKNITDNTFSDSSHIQHARRYTRDQYDIDGNPMKVASIRPDLVADEKLFNKLCKVFSEFEYRIYLKNGNDFRFPNALVDTIVMPGLVKISGTSEVVNIAKLKTLLEQGTVPEVKDVVDLTGETDQGPITYYTKGLVNNLIKLLTGPYEHVGVELVPNTTGAYDTLIPRTKTTLNKYLRTGELTGLDVEDEITLNKNNKISDNDHARKLINDPGNLIDWQNAKVIKGENKEPTVVAPINILGKVADSNGKFRPGAKWNIARIGAEVVLTAKDSEGNKYVLFVYKPRSDSFMELPGGGFSENPGSNQSFKNLLLSKLSYKCGIDKELLLGNDVKDTGKALLLNEKGVARNDEIKWPWSYYRLFTAELKYPIDGEELINMGYDELSYKHVNASYNAYLRWVPVDKLRSHTGILNRYSTLLQHGLL